MEARKIQSGKLQNTNDVLIQNIINNNIILIYVSTAEADTQNIIESKYERFMVKYLIEYRNGVL